jgi:diguanylate cyclase (GGDEF)-like protein/PAS domain S-box-containing protein
MISGPDFLLVVCDDAKNCDLILRCLSRHGFSASSVSTDTELLKQLQARHPDLVFLDLEMPGPNGIDILKTIRRTSTSDQLAVIIAIDKSGGNSPAEVFAAGANDYVNKPLDFSEVLARIQTQLSRMHAEVALRDSEERYALAALGANDGLWDWNLAANKICFSPRWKSMLGWEEHEISDDPEEWFRRIHPDDIDRVRADIAAHISERTPHYEDEYRVLHRDGNYLWMIGRGVAVSSGGEAYRMAGSQTDITRGKVVDVLTGLPNRVLFMDRLGRSFERARRRKDKTFALIFLDLDSFKLINDNMGHMIGDQLLIAIAARLEAAIRSTDSIARFGRNHTIARLGGDEFTILLEEISDLLDVRRTAERIAADMSIPFLLGGQELFPTASIGIALYNPSYQSPEDLLRDADIAMYSAKSHGKGRFEIFDADMRAHTIARLQLETELRRGIERREFENFYQVIVSLNTGRICGFEALIRWRHATRGLVTPKEFIPVAEETGLIMPIGRWSLESACQQMSIWQTRFLNNLPLMISANLSPRYFLQPDIAQQCASVLFETQLPNTSLNIEITESAMIADPESAIQLMRQLKSLGIKIALDDFGTGYSSLNYLHRFPLDSVKIDCSFIARIMEDDEMIRTILTLGRNLGLQVIAEGVETAEQAARLRELGCEFAQGFYFSVPINAQKATDLLAEEHHWAESPDAGHIHRWAVPPEAMHHSV